MKYLSTATIMATKYFYLERGHNYIVCGVTRLTASHSRCSMLQPGWNTFNSSALLWGVAARQQRVAKTQASSPNCQATTSQNQNLKIGMWQVLMLFENMATDFRAPAPQNKALADRRCQLLHRFLGWIFVCFWWIDADICYKKDDNNKAALG